jgi:hypothetical protein
MNFCISICVLYVLSVLSIVHLFAVSLQSISNVEIARSEAIWIVDTVQIKNRYTFVLVYFVLELRLEMFALGLIRFSN